MELKKKSLKESKHKFLKQCYESIETLPIYNWLQLFKENDYSFLLIRKRKVTKKEISFLIELWENIWSEYIDKFGFNESFISIHEKQKEIALLRLNKIKTGDRSWNTFINVALIELQEMKKESATSDFWTMKVAMEKEIGFRIDLKSTTVIEFYTQLNFLQKK